VRMQLCVPGIHFSHSVPPPLRGRLGGGVPFSGCPVFRAAKGGGPKPPDRFFLVALTSSSLSVFAKLRVPLSACHPVLCSLISEHRTRLSFVLNPGAAACPPHTQSPPTFKSHCSA